MRPTQKGRENGPTIQDPVPTNYVIGTWHSARGRNSPNQGLPGHLWSCELAALSESLPLSPHIHKIVSEVSVVTLGGEQWSKVTYEATNLRMV